MNVFVCDPDPRRAAQALADRHVVKMPLESTQIFCTLADELGLAGPGSRLRWYRPTHRSHPCTRGVSRFPEYRRWVAIHTDGLFNEYELRFGREHAAREVFERAVLALQVELDTRNPPPEPHASWPVCPQVEPDIVASYRRVLRDKYAAWGDLARWTKRGRPDWLAASSPGCATSLLEI